MVSNNSKSFECDDFAFFIFSKRIKWMICIIIILLSFVKCAMILIIQSSIIQAILNLVAAIPFAKITIKCRDQAKELIQSAEKMILFWARTFKLWKD